MQGSASRRAAVERLRRKACLRRSTASGTGRFACCGVPHASLCKRCGRPASVEYHRHDPASAVGGFAPSPLSTAALIPRVRGRAAGGEGAGAAVISPLPLTHHLSLSTGVMGEGRGKKRKTDE